MNLHSTCYGWLFTVLVLHIHIHVMTLIMHVDHHKFFKILKKLCGEIAQQTQTQTRARTASSLRVSEFSVWTTSEF